MSALQGHGLGERVTVATLPDHAAHIGDRLRAFRERAGLSQARLGQAASATHPGIRGVDERSVAHWERGRRTPRPAQLHALLEVLGVSDAELRELLEALAPHHPHYEILCLRWQQLPPEHWRIQWNQTAPGWRTHPAGAVQLR